MKILKISQSQEDELYFAALDDKNMSLAQSMVYDAAKKARYPEGPFWHGTDSDFTVFKNKGGKVHVLFSTIDIPRSGYFFSDNEEVAKSFGDKVMGVFLSMEQTADFTSNYTGHIIEELVQKGFNERWFYYGNMWDKFDDSDGAWLVFTLKSLGYDSAIIPEPGTDEREDSTSYIVFDQNQMKLSDPITFNDNGTVIPLSQRFNPLMYDIRY